MFYHDVFNVFVVRIVMSLKGREVVSVSYIHPVHALGVHSYLYLMIVWYIELVTMFNCWIMLVSLERICYEYKYLKLHN